MTGREAIRAFWQRAMDMGLTEARIETLEVEEHGDTAIELSKFTLYVHGGRRADAGKFIVIWKRKDGQWRLHRGIFNSSLPAPG
jgi:ketosteroid isomerase-like protein